jgi:hypothetical protein
LKTRRRSLKDYTPFDIKEISDASKSKTRAQEGAEAPCAHE